MYIYIYALKHVYLLLIDYVCSILLYSLSPVLLINKSNINTMFSNKYYPKKCMYVYTYIYIIQIKEISICSSLKVHVSLS